MDHPTSSPVGLTLKDLLVYLLRGWKFILLSAVILGILFGIYGGLSLQPIVINADTASLDEQKAGIKAEIDSINAQISEKDSSLNEQENMLTDLKNSLKDHSDDLKDRQEYLETLNGQLSAIQENYSTIEAILASAQSLYEITDDAEAKAALLSQIRSFSDRKLDLYNSIVAKELEIKDYKEELEDFSDTASLKKDISNQTKLVADINSEIADLKDNLKDHDEALEKLETLYTPSTIVPTRRECIVNAVKKAVIGGILGFVLSCGILFLKFYFSPVILNERDLAGLIGSDFYTSLMVSDRIGINGKIDRLAGICSSGKRDRIMEILVESISCKADEIVLTGSEDPDKLQALSDRLASLSKNACKISFVPCPSDNPSVLTACRGKSVLLVEVANKSQKKRISSLISLLGINNIPVVCCLTIN